ncbi:hypothetical protein ABPG72_019924 [Tetrahymena utriculariae]
MSSQNILTATDSLIKQNLEQKIDQIHQQTTEQKYQDDILQDITFKRGSNNQIRKFGRQSSNEVFQKTNENDKPNLSNSSKNFPQNEYQHIMKKEYFQDNLNLLQRMIIQIKDFVEQPHKLLNNHTIMLAQIVETLQQLRVCLEKSEQVSEQLTQILKQPQNILAELEKNLENFLNSMANQHKPKEMQINLGSKYKKQLEKTQTDNIQNIILQLQSLIQQYHNAFVKLKNQESKQDREVQNDKSPLDKNKDIPEIEIEAILQKQIDYLQKKRERFKLLKMKEKKKIQQLHLDILILLVRDVIGKKQFVTKKSSINLINKFFIEELIDKKIYPCEILVSNENEDLLIGYKELKQNIYNDLIIQIKYNPTQEELQKDISVIKNLDFSYQHIEIKQNNIHRLTYSLQDCIKITKKLEQLIQHFESDLDFFETDKNFLLIDIKHQIKKMEQKKDTFNISIDFFKFFLRKQKYFICQFSNSKNEIEGIMLQQVNKYEIYKSLQEFILNSIFKIKFDQSLDTCHDQDQSQKGKNIQNEKQDEDGQKDFLTRISKYNFKEFEQLNQENKKEIIWSEASYFNANKDQKFSEKYLKQQKQILFVLQNFEYNLCDYQKGLDFALESLKLRSEIFGDDDLQVAQSQLKVGSNYSNLDDNENALKYLFKSLNILKQDQEKNILFIVNCLDEIGICFKKHFDFQKSLEYLRKSLEIKEHIFYIYDTEIIKSLNIIGLCFLDYGDYDMASKFLIDSFERIGSEKPSIKAEALYPYEECLKICQKIMNDDYELIKYLLNNIGVIHFELNEDKKALEYFLRSMEIEKQIPNQSEQVLAYVLYFISLAYLRLGEYQNSLNSSLKSLNAHKTLQNKCFSKEYSFNISIILYIIGYCYQNTQNIEVASNYFQESEEVNIQIWNDNDPSNAKVERDLVNQNQVKMDSKQSIQKQEEQLALAKQKQIETFLKGKGYIVYERIGSGLFGEVFRAIQNLKRISFSRKNDLTQKVDLSSYQEVELKYRFEKFLFYNVFGISNVTEAIKIISQYDNIVSFILDISENSIDREGTKGIRAGLQKLQNLTNLTLDIRNYQNLSRIVGCKNKEFN